MKVLKCSTVVLFALISINCFAQQERKFSMLKFASFFNKTLQWQITYDHKTDKFVDSSFSVIKTEKGLSDEEVSLNFTKYTFKDNTFLTIDYDKEGDIIFIKYYYNNQKRAHDNEKWQVLSWIRSDKPPYHMKGNWHVGETIMAKK